jgi:DNA-binding transcriptional regulator YiaG
MPNVAKVLKEEIARIARKQSRVAVRTLKKPVSRLKKTVAELKRRTSTLERETKRLAGALEKALAAVPAPVAGPAVRARVTAKGMRSVRRRLKLSQAEFGKLVGVSGPAVLNWEKKQGALRLRSKTREAILAVRGIGAREARKRLAEQTSAARKPAARRRRKR